MVQTLTTRIALPLAFELVRQRIFDILTAELANQVALAGADNADIEPYQIAVYQEKSNPWQSGAMPCVNIWYDNASIDTSVAPPTSNQQGDHFYNLDLYYRKPSEEDENFDVIFGDTLVQLAVQAGASIIYQILMADLNTRLQFSSRVAGKPVAFFSHRQIIEMITYKQTFGDHPVDDIAAFRLRLKTVHLELVPNIEGLPLEGFDFILRRMDSTIPTDIEIEIDT